MLQIDEMVLVVKPYLAFQTPMVVQEIRVKEHHAPTLLRRRKTAQKQHFRILRQKRLQRMALNHNLSFNRPFREINLSLCPFLNLIGQRREEIDAG